jgi:hypothetical protein
VSDDGDWLVTLKATYGAYTAVTQDTIVYEKQCED